MKTKIDATINSLTDHLFRTYYGKMVSYLSQKYGYHEIENIVDAVQESFEAALVTWKFAEVPQNPFAWLYKVATNKLLNKLKQNKTADRQWAYFDIHSDALEHSEQEVDDSLLKLLVYFSKADFSQRNKLIISLYYVCGFNYVKIANAMLLKIETVKKILLRSKKTIKEFSNAYGDFELAEIVEFKHLYTILYLLFNEGYKSSQKKGTLNSDLCFEAMRLGQLIHQYYPKDTLISSLLSLMFFNAARFPARIKEEIWISIEDQDRDLWNKELIQEGFYYLNFAKENQIAINGYYIEALISSIHCTSISYVETDWKKIAYLYALLENFKPVSLSIQLNRLIAESKFKAIEEVLEQLEELHILVKEETSFAYFSTKAYLYRQQLDDKCAKENYNLALVHAHNKADINFIKKKLEALT